MKRIELKVDDNFNVNKVSFVDEPAIESNFQYFKKQNIEKRLVTGPAMRPNIDIPRIDIVTREEYSVWFSEETVRQASELFMKNNNQNTSNLNHKFSIDGVTVVESYIIQDENINNAKALGFTDVKKGDWWVTFKVYNDELWNEFIKTGVVKGFSVEGSFIEQFTSIFEKQFIDCDKLFEELKGLNENNIEEFKNKISNMPTKK